MLAGVALLAVLDGTIISPDPDLTRGAIALVLTVLVGGFIVGVWRSNSRLEKVVAGSEKPVKGEKFSAGKTTAG